MPLQDNENSDIQSEKNLNAAPEIGDKTLPGKEVSETDEQPAPADKTTADETTADETTAENEIAEAAADLTTVENIEHIEKVEITGKGISTFMTYFPHLVVGLISLVALAGLIFIMYINNKNAVNPSETARSLITYLVAVFTIVIALTLTLMAFFGNMKDFKERFAMGKEILTILIGVLGTIIGFYFGAAEPEKKIPSEQAVVSPSVSPSVSPDANGAASTTADAVTTAALTENNNSSKVPTDTQKQIAKVKEREGFEQLIAGDYESAISAFQASENAWNGYHSTYDIARLLRKNKTQMDDPAKKKEVLGIIVSQYQYGAPKDLLERLNTAVSQ